MKQCELRNGNAYQTSWLPNEYAKLGKILSIRNPKTEEWEHGWEVISVGKLDISYNEALDRSRDYTRTRKASDI